MLHISSLPFLTSRILARIKVNTISTLLKEISEEVIQDFFLSMYSMHLYVQKPSVYLTGILRIN